MSAANVPVAGSGGVAPAAAVLSAEHAAVATVLSGHG